MELKQNHIYLAKNLPVRRSRGLFDGYSTNAVRNENEEIQRIEVKEVTGTCYLLNFVGGSTPFYIEKTNTDVTYLEDLGVIAQ